MSQRHFMVFPAIDMKGGRCVRLRQGRAEDETVYSNSPLDMALQWEAEGGEFLHLVDLDGAFEARPVHRDIVIAIAQKCRIPVEIGGGLRTEVQIADYLDHGVRRVIIGTRACDEPEELKRLAETFGDKLAVGIDARDGFVQVKGWTETTRIRAVDLARSMEAAGVKTIIYTDTSRDGMMAGVNLDGMASMCDAVSCEIVASGGVTTLEDVKALKALDRPNLAGVIVGKALYEGTVTMESLLCI